MDFERGVIVHSLDYVKGVFYNVDFHFIFHDFLGIKNFPLEDDSLVAPTEWRLNYSTHVGFTYNGISVTANVVDVIKERVDVDDRPSFFNHVFSNIYFDIKGDGCRYLRSINPDFDNYIREYSQYDDLGNRLFHFTRIDFTFDFFNYKPEFFLACFDHLKRLDVEGYAGCPVASSNKPLTYSINLGSQQTFRLGVSRSPKMLVVYNKLLERGGLFPKDLPFSDSDMPVALDQIKTWWRIEMRTTDDKKGTKPFLMQVLKGMPEPMQRLRFVFDSFAFVDKNREICKFWVDLFDWETISPIIQNLHFDKFVTTRDRLLNQFSRWAGQGAAFLDVFGVDYLIQAILDAERDQVNRGRFSYAYKNRLEKILILLNAERDHDGNLIKDHKCLSDCPNIKLVGSRTGKCFYVSKEF